MLLLGDLLKLQAQSKAEKFLKPWWDVVIDYLILVLVMIAVVCGVVGLYAAGPVCMPVLHCPSQNSSLTKTATCATIHNPSQNGKNSSDSATVAVQFTNRNMFDYINTECLENICWMVRLFPNILIIMAGCCLVCSNAWFVLKSPILEQFSDLLHQCYKHASTEPPVLDERSSSQESTTSVTYTIPNTTPTCATTQQPTISVTYTTPTCATVEDRNRVKTKLKKFVDEFEENDSTNCKCCPNFCSICIEDSDENDSGNIEESDSEDIEENDSDDSEENDSTNCKCCRNFGSIKILYILISGIQIAIAIAIFGILVWLLDGEINRHYECNIDEIIPGLVYDHFVCSYSIAMFYSFCAGAFSVIIGLHIVFSFMKLTKVVWLLNAVTYFKRVNNLDKVKESPDLVFLLKLVKLSNPAYLGPFCKLCEEAPMETV